MTSAQDLHRAQLLPSPSRQKSSCDGSGFTENSPFPQTKVESWLLKFFLEICFLGTTWQSATRREKL